MLLARTYACMLVCMSLHTREPISPCLPFPLALSYPRTLAPVPRICNCIFVLLFLFHIRVLVNNNKRINNNKIEEQRLHASTEKDSKIQFLHKSYLNNRIYVITVIFRYDRYKRIPITWSINYKISNIFFRSLAVGSKSGYKLYSINSAGHLEKIYENGNNLLFLLAIIVFYCSYLQ